MEPTAVLIIYILLINIIAFVTYGLDKRKAAKNRYRIPEATLFALAIAGGSIGALTGMYTFRHKTKKWYFKFGIPLILILQIGLVVCISINV